MSHALLEGFAPPPTSRHELALNWDTLNSLKPKLEKSENLAPQSNKKEKKIIIKKELHLRSFPNGFLADVFKALRVH